MSVKLFDRVKQFTFTEGTGVISLSTTPNGFQSFSSVLSNNDATYYVIENKGSWEVGYGVYNSGSLTRSVVLDSNTGSRINLSGKSNVFITLPADKMVFLDNSGISNLSIDKLSNTKIDSAQSGDLLTFNGSFWENNPPAPTYSDENAQDAVGGIFQNSSTINISYDDNTPSIIASIPNGAITNSLIATGIDVSKLTGVISSNNLPSYVDDVLEYANLASLPPTGEGGKIYLILDSNRSYRWSGSQYVEITDTTALWGSITGTISSQTDLINYFVPQSRIVTAGIGLSGGGSLSGDITLNLANTTVATGTYGSPTGVASFTVDAQGRIISASEISINGLVPSGGTEGQILAKNSATNYDTGWIDNYSKELVQVVKNSTHTTLTKGQVVYINGADGTNPTIALASSSGESTSSKTLGFLKQDLNHGDVGYVVTEGFLDGLNTNSATTEGDPIWLSTTPGSVLYGLANKPYAPTHMVFLGFVVRKNANNGRIYVKVQNGFELDELHNVLAKNPTDGDIIRYVGSSGLWVSGPMPVSYTNEDAQDAVGGILTNTSTINLSYSDNTPSISATIPSGAITESLLATGINVSKFTNDVGYLTTHPPISAAPSSDNSGRTYIQDIILDSNGHVTGITTATETVVDTNTTYSAGTGLSLAGTTFSLANTTVASGVYGSENQVGQFTVDSQGRLTSASNISIPDASTTARGLVTTGTQTFGGAKTFALTWNNAGQNLTCINGNVTDTASASGSTLINLSVNGTSKFSVNKSGIITFDGTVVRRITSGTTNPTGGADGDIYFQHQDATDIVDFVPTTRTLTINGVSYDLSANRSWTISATGLANLNGLTIGTQTLQPGTTGTDFNIVSSGSIHTFNLPDASATARGVVTTGAQTFTGSKTLLSAGTTDTPLKVQVVANQTGNAQQWLGSAGTVEGYVSVYTDSIKGTLKTAIAVDRLLLMDGNENVYSTGGVGAGGALRLWWSANGEVLNVTGQGFQQVATFVSSGTGSVFNTSIGFAAAGINSSTVDVLLVRDAANILNQRNGTNPQTRRVTNTYTSTTSYEWLSIGWSSNICTIATEKGSAGGADRSLRVQGFEIPVNYTASPNNTVNHLSMQATGATANVSVSIVPKGTGSFSLAVPDSTTTGGNVRGANAIDLQTSRTNANQVASGANSVAIGINNRASADGSVAIGSGSTVTAVINSVAIGASSATGGGNGRCVAIGNATASSEYAIAIGHSTASGAGSIAITNESGGATAGGASVFGPAGSTASGICSTVLGGGGAASRANELTFGFRHSQFDVRPGGFFLSATTTNATATALQARNIFGASNFTTRANTVLHGTLHVTGIKSDGSAVAVYTRRIILKNVGGTITLVENQTIGTDYEDNANTNLTISNASPFFEVTGILNETWRWSGWFTPTCEMTYGT